MACRVVCISSEDGAGAQEAALLAAQSLGFRLIDEEVVARAALEAGVDEKVVADVERRKSALVRVIEGMGTAGVGAGYAMAPPQLTGQEQPPSDALRGLIRSAIEEMAGEGSAVIVAHAASLALGERADVLRVMVTASPQTRRRRFAGALGLDDKEAGRRIKRSDANRADYIKRFYDIAAELPTHYDLVINTDKLSSEQAARLIVEATAVAAPGTSTPQPVAPDPAA